MKLVKVGHRLTRWVAAPIVNSDVRLDLDAEAAAAAMRTQLRIVASR